MKRFTFRSALTVLSAVLAVSFASCARSYPVSSEDDIIGFLNDRDIAVTGVCTKKTVTIPQEFGDVYESYNELQRSQGFDLSAYRSREAEVYTFEVVSVRGDHTDNTEAHVMVCDDRIIGGDLASPALDGGMSAF